LGSVAPITQSVGNTVKRVVVIVAAALVFRTPMTPMGIAGACPCPSLSLPPSFPASLSLSTDLPTYLRSTTYLPTYLPTYPPTHLPTYPPTHLPTYPPTQP
ncbi:hypothetical protein T484DRAFT_1642232, partial [Baffinella frigidus]